MHTNGPLSRHFGALILATLSLCVLPGCAEQQAPTSQAPALAPAPPPPPVPAQAAVAAKASTNVMPARERVAHLKWGQSPTTLGRSRPAEANPEAPMAIAGDAGGQLWILDQVQNRLVQLERGALGRAMPVPLRAPEDLTLHDELVLVLDRLVDKHVVALTVSDGKERWRLPVVQADLHDGGGVSGLFVHKGGVWLEWAHSRSLRIGAMDGSHDAQTSVLPSITGRPSRDGELTLAASKGSPLQVVLTGRNLAAAADVNLPPTWGIDARFDQPVLAIRALESDPWGRIWLAVNTFVEKDDGTVVDERLELLRYGPDRKLHGRQQATVEQGPEEQMRTFSVGLDGTFWHLARREDGAIIERWAP